MKLKSLDEILKYLPILGVILIISGNIKLLIYYKEFNLEIFPFIKLDEILILFMQNSLGYLVLLLACILSLIIFKFNYEQEASNSLSKRIVLYITNKRLFILLVLFSITCLIYNSLRPKPCISEMCILLGAFVFLTYLIPIIIQESYLKLKLNKEDLSPVLVITIFLSITTFSILSAFNEASKVKLGYYKTVEIEFENLIFKSNLNSYYIGQTQNYIFIYDSKKKSTTSYKIDKVKSIKF